MSIFGSSFWNVVLSIEYIRWWWSLKLVPKVVGNLNEYLQFVKIKSIPEPSPINEYLTVTNTRFQLAMCYSS